MMTIPSWSILAIASIELTDGVHFATIFNFDRKPLFCCDDGKQPGITNRSNSNTTDERKSSMAELNGDRARGIVTGQEYINGEHFLYDLDILGAIWSFGDIYVIYKVSSAIYIYIYVNPPFVIALQESKSGEKYSSPVRNRFLKIQLSYQIKAKEDGTTYQQKSSNRTTEGEEETSNSFQCNISSNYMLDINGTGRNYT